MILLIAAYSALAAYFRFVVRTDVIYSHFAYVPIILAGVWWGWKGAWVAGLLGLETFLLGFVGTHPFQVPNNALRALLLLAIFGCIAILRNRGVGYWRALQVSEEKYRQLVERSIAGIVMHRNGRILFANQRFADMTGHSPADLVGVPVLDLVDEEDRPRVEELLRRRREEGVRDLRYECRLLGRDRRLLWAEVLSSPVDPEEEPTILMNAYDITEKKKAEEERWNLKALAARQEAQLAHATRLAELGEMAGMIAHELNQPLTGIRNFARNATYMIENQAGTTDEIKGNLRRISEQVDRAASIITGVRRLTRREDPGFAPVDVNEVVAAAVRFLDPQMEVSGVEVCLSLDQSLPRIYGNRVRLEQVVLNLLVNARQAMRDVTERRLEIRTRLEEGAPLPVVLEVADSGIGFEPEDGERIFEPFFTTKDSKEGTGLGLSISSTIVKEHGGRIEARGEPERGATFVVRLPSGGSEGGT